MGKLAGFVSGMAKLSLDLDPYLHRSTHRDHLALQEALGIHVKKQ